VVYSDRQPLNIGKYSTSPMDRPHIRQIAVPMENEPRRYGVHESVAGTFNGDSSVVMAPHGPYYPTSRSTGRFLAFLTHRKLIPFAHTNICHLINQFMLK
jgi:hypothetical protein